MNLDDAAAALRDGHLARAHVLTRRAARPTSLWPAQLEELIFTPLGALHQQEEFERRVKGSRHLLADWLAPLDPAKARALLDLDAAENDNGPALLALAFLDPEAAQWRHAVHGDRILTPYAAAAALQWDVKAAVAILAEHDRLYKEGRVDKGPALVAFQAFRLWNGPSARTAEPASLAPFLDRLSPPLRRNADRVLALRLRAQAFPCAPPASPFDDVLWAGEAEKALALIDGPLRQVAFVNRFAVEDPKRARAALGDPDPITAADVAAYPALEPEKAEKILASVDRSSMSFFMVGWDSAWLHARWPAIAERLSETERFACARILFERRLAAGAFDPVLLESIRESWSTWAESIRTLARFKPEAALAEAGKAPDTHRVPTLQRVLEGESDTRTFDLRLQLLRLVAGEKHEAATRAALWLLLEEMPRWADEGRLLKIVEAVGGCPVEKGFWRLLFHNADRWASPDLRKAVFARGR